MKRSIVNILFSFVLILSLFTQVMMPHHHHHEKICFINNHVSEHVEETSKPDHCFAHEHENPDKGSSDHKTDRNGSYCFIKNLKYFNPQTKEEIKIKEIDIRFSCFYDWSSDFSSDERYKQLPINEVQEHLYSGLFIVKDKGLRGPPFC